MKHLVLVTSIWNSATEFTVTSPSSGSSRKEACPSHGEGNNFWVTIRITGHWKVGGLGNHWLYNPTVPQGGTRSLIGLCYLCTSCWSWSAFWDYPGRWAEPLGGLKPTCWLSPPSDCLGKITYHYVLLEVRTLSFLILSIYVLLSSPLVSVGFHQETQPVLSQPLTTQAAY